MLTDLYYSPIIRALALFLALMALLSFAIDVADLLDKMAVVAGALVIARYGAAACRSIRRSNPSPADYWQIGGVIVAMSITIMRGLHIADLHPLPVDESAFLYSAATAVLAFGLMLKFAAPEAWHLRRRLSPVGAVTIGFVLGVALDGVLELIEWLLA